MIQRWGFGSYTVWHTTPVKKRLDYTRYLLESYFLITIRYQMLSSNQNISLRVDNICLFTKTLSSDFHRSAWKTCMKPMRGIWPRSIAPPVNTWMVRQWMMRMRQWCAHLVVTVDLSCLATPLRPSTCYFFPWSQPSQLHIYFVTVYYIECHCPLNAYIYHWLIHLTWTLPGVFLDCMITLE